MKEVTSAPVVHLAGNAIAVRMPNGKIRAVQRCLICGRKLEDSNALASVNNLDDESLFTPWVPGAWVQEEAVSEDRIEFTRVGHSLSPDNTEDTPDDCCIVLVEY